MLQLSAQDLSLSPIEPLPSRHAGADSAGSSLVGNATRWLRAVGSRQWTWPLPALGLGALTLWSSDAIWQRAPAYSRWGQTEGSPASTYLGLMASCSLVYWALSFPPARDIIRSMSGRLREPSEAEAGCAVVFLRLASLAILYSITWLAVERYLFVRAPS